MRVKNENEYLKKLVELRDSEIVLILEKILYMENDHRHEIGKISAEKKRAEAHIAELKKSMNLQ